MSWRLYARRTTTGVWLDTNVQMAAELTFGFLGASRATATLPWANLRPNPTVVDLLPFWLERGTTLYAEQDGALRWVGLVDYTRPTPTGLEIEFKGLASGYDLMWFDGRIREWEPSPYAVVKALMANAHAQPHGDFGMVVTAADKPARTAGDDQPPPRPEKPKRRKGESKDHYDDRLLPWQEAVDDWDDRYGDLEPYALASWELQYVGKEIAELAAEIPFQAVERHTWVDRDNLVARSELVLSQVRAPRRADIALVEGRNVAEVLEPATNTDVYGNHAVVAGAGEGSKMKLAQSQRDDGRIRTTRFAQLKTAKQQQRLRQAADNLRARAVTSVVLEAAKVDAASVVSLQVGDEIQVTSRRFTGWCRVSEITVSTAGGPTSLAFSTTTDGKLTL